jgi:hypothetical protein
VTQDDPGHEFAENSRLADALRQSAEQLGGA